MVAELMTAELAPAPSAESRPILAIDSHHRVVGLAIAYRSQTRQETVLLPAWRAKEFADDPPPRRQRTPHWGMRARFLTREECKRQGAPQGRGGVLVEATQPGAAAANCGLAPGDVILKADGRALRDVLDLTLEVLRAGPRKAVKFTLWRQGKEVILYGRPAWLEPGRARKTK